MNYVKYNRSFVMMEEQSVQFAAKESAPIKGYLKVETGNNKGALRCVVQNLKYFDKGDYIYKLILFGKKGERTIHTVIGNLLVNKQGNGETYFRFLPLDVTGKETPTTTLRRPSSPPHPQKTTGNHLSCAKGVTYSEVEPFQSELFQVEEEIESGQSQEIDDIISKIDKIVEDIEEAIQSEADSEDVPEAVEAVSEIFREEPAEEFEENEMTVAAASKEEAAEMAPEEKIDETAPEEKIAETAPEEKIAETAPKEKIAGTPPKREPGAAAPGRGTAAPKEVKGEIITKKTYNNFYNEYILSACAHTCRIAEFYEDVAPFERDKTGARWKKIVNITNLPLVSPGAHYFATQYRHYIFGAKPDEKGMATKFYFGIPGRFLDEEQPDGGKSGFTYWQPIRGADPAFEGYRKGERANRNAYGYWIIAVDGKTGNIEEV